MEVGGRYCAFSTGQVISTVLKEGCCFACCLEPIVLHLTSSLLVTGYPLKVSSYLCFESSKANY